jgi:peptidoglycan/LPS O-acetylase OafA/YrhL
VTRHPLPPRRFPGLDGLRAIGAVFVLTTHVGFHSGASLNSAFNGILSRMDSGVAIFFVISGFLLFRPHAVAWLRGEVRPRASVYARHRALRILPALWLAVAGAAVLLPHDADVSIAHYAFHATLTQIYVPGHETSGLTQMWSLSTEAAFYLALPVLAWAFFRYGDPTRRGVVARLAVLATLPAVGAAWMALAAATGHPQWGVWLPGFVGWFGLGMALALWQAARSSGVLRHTWLDDLARHPWTVWSLAAGLYLVIISPLGGPYDLSPPTPGQAATKNVAYAALGLLVVLPAVAALREVDEPSAVRALGGRLGRFLGDISYGLFCYHLIVLGLVEQALGYRIFTGGFPRLWVATLAITVGVAALSFYALERPIMRRGRRAERPGPSPATPDTAAATASSAAS